MRKSLLIIVPAILIALSVLSPAAAQYYNPNPYYNAPYPPRTAAQSSPQAARNPQFYRLVPTPELIWKWDQQIRWLDFQNQQRSPSYPESVLEYMLRTF